MTKGADCPDWRLGKDCSPPVFGNTGGLGPVTPASPGELTRQASDPTSREVQLLRTTKQNKGARRGRSHYGAFQSPLAPSPQPEPSHGSSPASPLAADQGLGSPWSLVSPRPPVTAAGEAARGAARDGKTRWLHPSSLLLHPSLRVPAAWPPSARARLARAHPRERVAFV